MGLRRHRRGEARPDSDIDLAAGFAPEVRLSLTGFASQRADLSAMLGAPMTKRLIGHDNAI
ncbi:hypothetical protein [Siccirubricoccus sp. G192]|uniref:hypothetical protein n=1 Tax=Siccirubricoccus sp. G192 TaxID=2849651 RepID=UPI001C2C72D5|nr:hypothetical protein [Siccirubricoccus sp. G192]MBV1795884.1 hypothetical protein [Siccirubricoccus sp. G192]